MAQEIRNPSLRFVVHAHLVLACGAAAQVRWIGMQWFGEADWHRPAAAFLATFACYGLLRLVRSREQGLLHVPLFAWYRAHRKAMMIAIAASAMLAMALLGAEARELIARLWPVMVPALLYVVPLRGKDGRVFGLRRVPLLKSFLVAWVWAAGTVLLAADEVNGMAWLLVTVHFCFYLAIAIAFDLRDMGVDPPALRTVPQLVGARIAKAMAILLLLPMACKLVVQHALTMADDRDASLMLPLIGLSAGAILIARASPVSRWTQWLLLDACIGLVPMLAWLGRLL